MQSNVDEEGQLETPMQAEGSGDEGLDSGGSKGSKRSKGASGEKSTSTAEENTSSQVRISRIPLEDMLKGLIISQIRAPFVQVEEGLLNLLRDCLIAEHPFSTSVSLSGHTDHFQSVDDEDLGWGCGWRNIQILCSFLLAEDPETREVLFNGAGFVPDIPALQTWLEVAWAGGFDEPGAEYFDWAISGTRKWIGTTECAALLRSFGVRAKIVSFTALGGKRVRGGLDYQKSGSSTADQTDDDEHGSDILNEGVQNCPGPTDTSNSRGGAINCSECCKICEHGISYRGIVNKESELCDSCMKEASQKGASENRTLENSGRGGGYNESGGKKQQKEEAQTSGSGGDSNESRVNPEDSGQGDNAQKHMKLPTREEPSRTEHHWNFECDGCGKPLKGRRYKSLMTRNFELCSNCMKGVEENPAGARGSHKDYVIIEEHPASRNSGPPVGNKHREEDIGNVHIEDVGIDQDEKVDDVKLDTSREEGGNVEVQERGRERGGKSVEEKDTEDGPQPENAAGSKPLENGERGKAGMHRTFSGGDRDSADINHHHLIEWVWSYFTEDSTRRFAASSQTSRDLVTMSKRSPLYFQHRGHSRTIVGIERRRKPTGMSEDVYLLILDPSVSTELLAKSLREKRGWQTLIKNDVHTLKEAEYQLCYADPGIAVGEELEQLKVLSSLRYSYYSK